MTNIGESKIDVIVLNGHNIKCKLKGTVNIKLQGVEKFKLTEVLYSPQVVKNILSGSRLISKRSTMGSTKDKMTIKKCGINVTSGAIQGINESTIF